MEKFVRLTAKACPLMIPNLNTDQILPARYLKWPRSRGLGAVVFHDFRLDAEGHPRADIPLNQDVYSDARILLASTFSDRRRAFSTSLLNAGSLRASASSTSLIRDSYSASRAGTVC